MSDSETPLERREEGEREVGGEEAGRRRGENAFTGSKVFSLT